MRANTRVLLGACITTAAACSGGGGGGSGYTAPTGTAGTFNFHCSIHPSMTGTVTVQ